MDTLKLGFEGGRQCLCHVCGFNLHWVYAAVRPPSLRIATVAICVNCGAHPGCHPSHPGHELCRLQRYCRAPQLLFSPPRRKRRDPPTLDQVAQDTFVAAGLDMEPYDGHAIKQARQGAFHRRRTDNSL